MPTRPRCLRTIAAVVLATILGIACVPPGATPAPTPTPVTTPTSAGIALTPTIGAPTVTPKPTSTPADIPGPASTPPPSPSATQTPTALTLSLTLSERQLAVGQTTSVALTLRNAKTGLSGYDLTVRIEPSNAAEIAAVRLPDFGLTQVSELPASNVRIQVADLNNKVQSGDQAQLLATLELRSKAAGEAAVTVQLAAMDDEHGNPLNPLIASESLQIR